MVTLQQEQRYEYFLSGWNKGFLFLVACNSELSRPLNFRILIKQDGKNVKEERRHHCAYAVVLISTFLCFHCLSKALQGI